MSRFRDPDRSACLIDVLAPSRKTRIVDIGANPINENPYQVLQDLKACEVWGFEPQKEAFEELLALDNPDEHYFNTAVGSGKPATLNICAASGTTSLLTPNIAALDFIGDWHKYFKVVSSEIIETRKLDDFDDIPDFDLLKIDVQGAEVEVFRSGQEKLKRACSVITEVAAIPLYQGQPLLGEQMTVLGDMGYHLHKFLFFKDVPLRSPYLDKMRARRIRSQLIDGDAVFIKDLLELEKADTETIKHLAILADTVFESLDLVLYCLAFLEERGQITRAKIDIYQDRMPLLRSPDNRNIQE